MQRIARSETDQTSGNLLNERSPMNQTSARAGIPEPFKRLPCPLGRRLDVLSRGRTLSRHVDPEVADDGESQRMSSDLVIRSGHVIDPASGLDGKDDVAVKDGRIAAVGLWIDGSGAEVRDAAGSYVVPGLIDLHTHVY